jgi:hypothetical protein
VYDKIRNTLEQLGFKANAYDDCVFTRKNAKDKIMACIHVDDMFISGTNDAAVNICSVCAFSWTAQRVQSREHRAPFSSGRRIVQLYWLSALP